MIAIIIFLAAAALIIWFITIYNKLVRVRTMVLEAWSGIDVQLKRRADLIPNLVEMVKGYMEHEKELLNSVTELRSRSMDAKHVTEKGDLEGQIGRSIANILAVAEQYPDLKANQNFMELHEQLSRIENEIQLARRYYNGTVRDRNILVESFPSNLVARQFNFTKAEYFEIGDENDKEVPEINFGSSPN